MTHTTPIPRPMSAATPKSDEERPAEETPMLARLSSRSDGKTRMADLLSFEVSGQAGCSDRPVQRRSNSSAMGRAKCRRRMCR